MIFLALISVFLELKAAGAENCGWPGRPHAGQLVVKREGFLLPPAPPPESHPPGDSVEYSCPAPGHALFGPRIRTCREDGVWSPSLPFCGRNQGRSGSAAHSSTLWSYGADLGIDGDTSTCAWTNKEDKQRWWQLKLAEPADILGVRLNLKKENLQALTVFIIETLPNNRTVYKTCGHYNNSLPREPRVLNSNLENSLFKGQEKHQEKVVETDIVVEVPCSRHSDTFGDNILLRDDRKNPQYFTLCEIEVFSQEDTGCGDPEVPAGSVVRPSSPLEQEVSCREGFRFSLHSMEGPGANITCNKGTWNTTGINCEVVLCPVLTPPENGNLSISLDQDGREVSAEFSCSRGYVLSGVSGMECVNGSWSGREPKCLIPNCGVPPRVQQATALLVNGTTSLGDITFFSCNPGYIMVVNATSEPIAQERTSIVCTENSTWSPLTQFTCINASQLTTGWAGSASLSINIIYCLLALLITLIIPLILVRCCRNRCCRRVEKTETRSDLLKSPNSDLREYDLSRTDSVGSEFDAYSVSGIKTPSIGVYNVTTGSIIHPATVNPSTLRSFSTSHNTFKPLNYPLQPLSLHSWSSVPSSIPNIQSLPPGFLPGSYVGTPISFPGNSRFPGGSIGFPPGYNAGSNTRKLSKTDEPKIDESGYATLILKKEPLYEQVTPEPEPEPVTYDSVPRRYSVHEYMNTESLAKVVENIPEQEDTSSFPDLLEMVTKSKTPSPVARMRNVTPDNTDIAQLYAKVDLEKKRSSRPSSGENYEPVVGQSLDSSYTKGLINKFNSLI